MIDDDKLRAAYAPIHARDLQTLRAEPKLSPAGQKRLIVLREYQKHGITPVQFRAPVVVPPPLPPGPGSVFYPVAADWTGLGRQGNPQMLILGNPPGRTNPYRQSEKDFVWFLENTLIPDLRESGHDMTAESFEKGIDHFQGYPGGLEYANWLESTLIPDLKASGTTETAKDFSRLAKMIKRKYRRGRNPSKGTLLREAKESLALARSDVKAGHKGAAQYWEGRAAGLSQAALQNAGARIRRPPKPGECEIGLVSQDNCYRKATEVVEIGLKRGTPLRVCSIHADLVRRMMGMNPGDELECQYCGSGELVYMGQIGPNHAYRCRRCGMDLVVSIPPNPEYLARYISPSSEVREEVIKARGTKSALRKAERRAEKLPSRFTAPHSSVEVAPIGGPNPKVRRGPQLSVPEQHQLRIARQTLQMPDPIAAVMGGPTKAQSREIIRRLTRRSNPAGQYEVVFRSAGERWYSGPFRTREDAEAYAKLGESGWYGPRGDWKRAPLQWRVVPSTPRQGPVQVLWPNPYVAVDRMSGRVSSVQRGERGRAYEKIKDWAEDVTNYSGRAQDVYWKRRDSKRLKVGVRVTEDMIPNPCGSNPGGCKGRRCSHNGIPGYIWHDPRFQAELRAYKKRHGTGPIEIRGIKVPKGYPKFMSVYGRAPHAVYDAPSHSNKGKRIHHFGGRGKSQPWLVSSVERGPKFLAYVGGTFRARPDWLYD